MDLTFQTDSGVFNYRVCAMILHDNRILAMQDDRSPYYYLPGGRTMYIIFINNFIYCFNSFNTHYWYIIINSIFTNLIY